MSDRRCLAARGALICGLALGLAHSARADEGGISFWLPGQYSSLAAVPPPAGFYLAANGYAYSGSAGGGRSFPIGINIASDVKGSLYGQLLTALYVPETPVLGGRLSVGLTGLYAKSSARGRIDVGSLSRTRTDTVWGFGDLYPLASLSWNAGVHNGMLYMSGDIPVGAYDSNRLANIGIGHGAIDAGGSYTYLDPKKGREFSATAGFTENFENTATDYKNGVDFHLDVAAAQFLSKHFYVGIAGYWYRQISADSGSGARLGSFESSVAAAGPQLGYLFEVGGHQASLSLRGYWEFDAANRVEGTAAFLSLAVPLWTPTATAAPAAPGGTFYSRGPAPSVL